MLDIEVDDIKDFVDAHLLKFIIGCYVVVGLVVAFCGYKIYTMPELYENQISEQQTACEDLKAKIAKIESDSASTEQIKARQHFATEVGQALAASQSKYSNLHFNEQKEYATTLYENMQAYTAQKQFALPWVISKQVSVNYEWKFNTTMSFDTESLSCLFTCYEGRLQQRMLAYAVADYNSTTKTFDKVRVVLTSAGKEVLSQEVPGVFEKAGE